MEIKGYHFPSLSGPSAKKRKKKIIKKAAVSVVLAPGVPAFSAPEKTDLALIGSTELTEPPDCKIVLAFGALDLDGGHGLFLAFLLNDHNLIFRAHFLAFHLVTCFNLPDIPAFPALQLTGR
jgi:hypothetical protein